MATTKVNGKGQNSISRPMRCGRHPACIISSRSVQVVLLLKCVTFSTLFGFLHP